MSEVIFEDFGIRVLRDGTRPIVEYDSGESAGSRLVRKRISPEQTVRATQSEAGAYAVLLELEEEPELR